eukprot:5321484-Amphidinium_carterae.2
MYDDVVGALLAAVLAVQEVTYVCVLPGVSDDGLVVLGALLQYYHPTALAVAHHVQVGSSPFGSGATKMRHSMAECVAGFGASKLWGFASHLVLELQRLRSALQDVCVCASPSASVASGPPRRTEE